MVALFPISVEAEPESYGWISFESSGNPTHFFPVGVESEPEPQGWLSFESPGDNPKNFFPVGIEQEPEPQGWITYATPDPVTVYTPTILLPPQRSIELRHAYSFVTVPAPFRFPPIVVYPDAFTYPRLETQTAFGFGQPPRAPDFFSVVYPDPQEQPLPGWFFAFGQPLPPPSPSPDFFPVVYPDRLDPRTSPHGLFAFGQPLFVPPPDPVFIVYPDAFPPPPWFERPAVVWTPDTVGLDTGAEFGVPYVVPVPVPVVLPQDDTIRGGLQVIVAAATAPLLDTSADADFKSAALSPLFAPIVAGTGAVTPTLAGVVLDTGLTAGSSASVETVFAFRHFDAAVDVEVLIPDGPVARPVDLAVFELQAGTKQARVRLVRGLGADPRRTLAFAEVTGGVNGPVVAPLEGNKLSLRLVRNGRHVWVLVGQRKAVPTGSATTFLYRQQTQLLEFHQLGTTAGGIRIRTANNSLAGRVRVRLTNFTIRPHATIGGRLAVGQENLPRLLVGKRELGDRRVVGAVPPATLEEVGLADIVVFGLFGEVVKPDSFRYLLPPPLTVGRSPEATLIIVSDEALKDVDE